MCGIVGYVGQRPAQEILLAGLQKLEYRGYDSAGISMIGADGEIETFLDQIDRVLTHDALSASATLTSAALPMGSHAITVTYNGDSNFAVSTGSMSQSVSTQTTSTVVTSTWSTLSVPFAPTPE